MARRIPPHWRADKAMSSVRPTDKRSSGFTKHGKRRFSRKTRRAGLPSTSRGCRNCWASGTATAEPVPPRTEFAIEPKRYRLYPHPADRRDLDAPSDPVAASRNCGSDDPRRSGIRTIGNVLSLVLARHQGGPRQLLLRKQGAMPADDFRKRRLLHAKPMVSGARWPPQAVNALCHAAVWQWCGLGAGDGDGTNNTGGRLALWRRGHPSPQGPAPALVV